MLVTSNCKVRATSCGRSYPATASQQIIINPDGPWRRRPKNTNPPPRARRGSERSTSTAASVSSTSRPRSSPARLVAFEVDHAVIEIDDRPVQRQHLALAHAGVQKQAQRREAEHPLGLLPRRSISAASRRLSSAAFKKFWMRRDGVAVSVMLVRIAHAARCAEREQALEHDQAWRVAPTPVMVSSQRCVRTSSKSAGGSCAILSRNACSSGTSRS